MARARTRATDTAQRNIENVPAQMLHDHFVANQ